MDHTLCITVAAPTMATLRQRRDLYSDSLVELRLDTVDRPDVPGALAGRQGPVIVTCRPTWEGGHFQGSEAERLGMLEAALEAGAEEVNDLGDSFEIVSEATDLIAVRTALQEAGIDYDSADPTFLPSMQVPLDAEGARKVFKLIDALEDSDEVQNVYSNFDVSDQVLEEVNA